MRTRDLTGQLLDPTGVLEELRGRFGVLEALAEVVLDVETTRVPHMSSEVASGVWRLGRDFDLAQLAVAEWLRTHRNDGDGDGGPQPRRARQASATHGGTHD